MRKQMKEQTIFVVSGEISFNRKVVIVRISLRPI